MIHIAVLFSFLINIYSSEYDIPIGNKCKKFFATLWNKCKCKNKKNSQINIIEWKQKPHYSLQTLMEHYHIKGNEAEKEEQYIKKQHHVLSQYTNHQPIYYDKHYEIQNKYYPSLAHTYYQSLFRLSKNTDHDKNIENLNISLNCFDKTTNKKIFNLYVKYKSLWTSYDNVFIQEKSILSNKTFMNNPPFKDIILSEINEDILSSYLFSISFFLSDIKSTVHIKCAIPEKYIYHNNFFDNNKYEYSPLSYFNFQNDVYDQRIYNINSIYTSSLIQKNKFHNISYVPVKHYSLNNKQFRIYNENAMKKLDVQIYRDCNIII